MMRRRGLVGVGRTDRGATMVEYALIVALFVVALIVVVHNLADNSASELSQRAGHIGEPTEDGFTGGGTGTGTGSGSGSGDSTSVTITVVPQMEASAGTDSGNKWYASIVITVTDQDGNPVGGATVTGDWVDDPGGSHETNTCSTAQGTGQCTVTISGLKCSTTNRMTYTLTDVTGSNTLTLTYTGGQGTKDVDKPGGC